MRNSARLAPGRRPCSSSRWRYSEEWGTGACHDSHHHSHSDPHSRTGSMSARHDVPCRTMNSMVASCPRRWRRKQHIQASQRCPAGDNRFFHMRGSLTSRVSGLYATYLQSKKSEEIQNNAQFGQTSPSLRLRLWTRMVRRCLGLLSKLRIRGPPSRAH